MRREGEKEEEKKNVNKILKEGKVKKERKKEKG